MAETTEPRGVKTRLFGMVLLFAATMDAMLHWRGGFALGFSTILLSAAGTCLYVIGVLRGGSRREQATEEK